MHKDSIYINPWIFLQGCCPRYVNLWANVCSTVRLLNSFYAQMVLLGMALVRITQIPHIPRRLEAVMSATRGIAWARVFLRHFATTWHHPYERISNYYMVIKFFLLYCWLLDIIVIMEINDWLQMVLALFDYTLRIVWKFLASRVDSMPRRSLPGQGVRVLLEWSTFSSFVDELLAEIKWKTFKCFYCFIWGLAGETTIYIHVIVFEFMFYLWSVHNIQWVELFFHIVSLMHMNWKWIAFECGQGCVCVCVCVHACICAFAWKWAGREITWSVHE